jgi:two-component system C4-dicarboxylate transport sensor histidine kinase DctB
VDDRQNQDGFGPSRRRPATGTPEAIAEPKHDGLEGTGHTEWLASLALVSATLAHELMQPLSVVQLMIQDATGKLKGLDCPEVVRQDLQDALAACSRIGEIVSRFRELARRPARQRETDVPIYPVAERTIRLLAPSAEQAKVRVWTENLETLPALRMRQNDLEQLFFALVQNAVQAADGLRDRHLLITGTRQDDTVILRFQDSCGGIDPAHLPQIFEPLFTTKPAGKGTGLGLCIARRIARRQGGQISVESRWGEGATFTVVLPRESNPTIGGRYAR